MPATITVIAGQPQPKWITGEVRTTLYNKGMIPVQQSVLSLSYVQVPVQVYAAGAAYNPTTDVVALAFTVLGADPVNADWHAGTWDTAPATNTYLAQILVGPTGLALARGTYAVWLKITDNPEIPVINAGTIQIV